MKNLCYESTSEGTDSDAKIHRFKEKDVAENRFIQVLKIELVNDQKRSKTFYKDSRSSNKIVQTLKGHRIILTSYKEPKVQLYQKSLNTLKTNREFAADTKYIKEYKIEQPNSEEDKLKLYKKPSKILKKNRIFDGEKHHAEEYTATVSYQKQKVKLYEKSNERKLVINFGMCLFCSSFFTEEDVNNLICNVDDLKTAEIKIYLKEFGLELNLKKSKLQKKLTKLLDEKRDSLLKTLQTHNSKVTEFVRCTNSAAPFQNFRKINYFEASKCPKCSSAIECYYDLRQLIEVDARYATSYVCAICERISGESENFFPMTYCIPCGHDECKSCVRKVNVINFHF